MATDSERIEKLERIVAALVATTPAAQAEDMSQTYNVLSVTDEQAAAVRQLLKSWVPLEGTEGGEFDPMDYMAANRGWLPLIVDEAMTVTLGKKKYTIRRDA